MRVKFEIMWKYCYLMAQRRRLSEVPLMFRNERLLEDEKELVAQINEIQEYVMEIASDYNMYYDYELNLFLEGGTK